MPDRSRRRALQAVGTAAVVALAGCSRSSDATPSTRTSQATSTTTDRPKTTTTERPPLQVTEQWAATDVDGAVDRLWLPRRPPGVNQTGGPLVAGSEGGTVLALDTGGDVAWRHDAPGDPTQAFEASGVLYLASDDWEAEDPRNYVEALDIESGERRWVYEAREFLRPLAVVEGRILLAGHYITASQDALPPEQSPSGEGFLHALDEQTGDQLWRESVPGLEHAAAAPRGVYALEQRKDEDSDDLHRFGLDGTTDWTVETGTRYSLHPEPIEGGVVAATPRGAGLYSAASGGVEWSVDAWDHGPADARLATAGPYEDTVFFGGEPLVAVGLDGRERWRLPEGGRVAERTWQDPVFVSRREAVAAVHPDSGDVAWEYAPDNAGELTLLASLDDVAVVRHGVWTDTEFGFASGPDGSFRGLQTTPARYRAMTTLHGSLFVGTSDGVYGYR